MAKPKPLTDDEIQSIAADAADDAVDFVQAEISPYRLRAERYFRGEVDIGHEEGRSKVVATKVRDTARAIKPSLMRVFMTHERPVEYSPVGPDDGPGADQATKYAMVKFHASGGYRLLNELFEDALLKKQGVAKVFWDEYAEAKVYTFSNLNEQEYLAVTSEEGVTVLEEEQAIEMTLDPASGMQVPTPIWTRLRVSRTETRGCLKLVAIPPENFFIDRNARSIEDCYACGTREDKRVGDLVADGFAFEDVVDLGVIGDSDAQDQAEDDERRGYSTDPDEGENPIDPSMKLVTITEVFMRMDVDGTGVPILHRVVLGGAGNRLLSAEPADEIPYALFEIDPIPHTAQGRSIDDLVHEDQDAATMMLRGILDNVALVNTPRVEAVEGQVNMGDLLNNEIGGVVRVRAPGMLRDLSVPFVAGQTLPALQYLDQAVEMKTGVTRASMGLDPDALQSTTRAAVTATVSAAAAQVEMMARNLAEGGMRRLFKLMLKLIVKHARGPEMVRMDGAYVPIDPRVWNVEMDVSVNVGLGTGQEEMKSAALMGHIQWADAVIAQFGPANGLVSLTQARNARADLLAMNGIRNADRYLMPMNPQAEQAIIQQWQQAQQAMAQAQQGGQPADPSGAIVAAEQIKAQVKMQELTGRQQIEWAKAQMQDDRERDRMTQDLAISQAELAGRHQIALDTNRIKAEQAAMRPPGGSAQ